MAQELLGSVHRYGDHPDQHGELYLPRGDRSTPPPAVVAILHGGFWRQRYRRDLTAPIARDLAAHGIAAWNLEFRRVEGDGGWPATFDDVAAGIDHLTDPAMQVDTSRVAVLGHSAGGHLALWAAGRQSSPAAAPGAAPQVVPTALVGLAPVADLHACHRSELSDGAARALLGGDPDGVPRRWELADPMHLVGHGVRTLLVHGLDDEDVPVEFSRRYAAAARTAGDAIELATPDGDHMSLIDPRSAGWALARDWLVHELAGRAAVEDGEDRRAP